jgi:hypothetical protein
MLRWLADNELARIRKEVVVAQNEVLPALFRRTEENQETIEPV